MRKGHLRSEHTGLINKKHEVCVLHAAPGTHAQGRHDAADRKSKGQRPNGCPSLKWDLSESSSGIQRHGRQSYSL